MQYLVLGASNNYRKFWGMELPKDVFVALDKRVLLFATKEHILCFKSSPVSRDVWRTVQISRNHE